MKIWLIIFLELAVFHGIQSTLRHRLVENATCLQLAKPSNQQFRLTCSNPKHYHCLLDETFSQEFEVCAEFKWIDEGKCAYFNLIGGQINQGNCIQKNNLTCSNGTDVFQSLTNTKYTACYIKKETGVQSQSRLVVNTSCLELAKPSNQQLRLKCSNPSYYHCLLDESCTKEFEVCREWKWIPGGKCAYFNTYGRGNIDERNCIQKTNLTCSHGIDQFSSATNTKYTACYVKKEIGTSLPATTNPTGTHSVNGISDGRNATSVSTTIDKRDQKAMYDLPAIILGFFVPFIPLAVIYLIFRNLKYVPLHKKGRKLSINGKNDDNLQLEPPLENNLECSLGNPQTMRHENEGRKSGIKEKINDYSELQSLLETRREESLENPPTIRHEDNDNTPEEQKGDGEKPPKNTAGSDNLNSAVEEEKAKNSTDEFNEGDKNLPKDNTLERLKGDDENPANSSTVSDPNKSDSEEENEDEFHQYNENLPGTGKSEEENEKESTDVFDDAIDTLQMIAPPTDDNDRKEFAGIYSLLDVEGWELSKKIMTATITMKTGKSVQTLINNLTEQEKSKLKEILPEEFNRILESKQIRETSFLVLYGLHLIYLDKEFCPKSGWGNPVWGKDIGIGDDVERLYRIQTIVRGISKPDTISIKSYIRLLDIMLKSLTRLNFDDEVNSVLMKKI